MKRIALRFYNYIFGVKGIVFILYTIFIFSAYAFTLYMDTSLSYVIRAVAFISIAALAFCPLILKKISEKEINLLNHSNTDFKAPKRFITYLLIALFVFLIYYLAYYPGGFSLDTINQYKQAISNDYNDWHPVLHTWLAIKLPLLLTNGWIGSITLFQIVFFSLALAYMSVSVEKYINRMIAYIVLAFALINPATGNLAMFAWKDISFAIVVLVLITFLFNIYFTDGQWIKNIRNTSLIVLLLVLATVFRHNGILFTLPYIIILFLFYTKKRGAIILVSVILLVLGIKGPLYSFMNVQKPDSRQIETLGVPMNIIGAVVANAPETLDVDVLHFAYEVAPKDVWEKEYIYGDFFNVKFNEKTNLNIIEDEGAIQVIHKMFKAVKASPQHALTGLFKLTAPVYSLNDNAQLYTIQAGILKNDAGITYQGFNAVRKVLNVYSKITSVFFSHLFLFVGICHIALIICLLAKCKLKTKTGIKKALVALPVFTYNFGTMLLLTSANDSSRFFYYTFLVSPLILIILISDNAFTYNKREGD